MCQCGRIQTSCEVEEQKVSSMLEIASSAKPTPGVSRMNNLENKLDNYCGIYDLFYCITFHHHGGLILITLCLFYLANVSICECHICNKSPASEKGKKKKKTRPVSQCVLLHGAIPIHHNRLRWVILRRSLSHCVGSTISQGM